MATWDISERAAALHNKALVWDAHAGFSPFPDLDLSFLERWLEAGVSYLSINVGYDIVRTWEETLRCTAHYRRWLELHPDTFLLAETVADVRRAKAQGKLAVGFDLEGADALDGNIEMISLYYRLGVRQMLFAYNRNNRFGGGCLDVDIPLTRLGREAVSEMNRVGMIVDCSHAGYRTSMEIMDLSAKPVIFSHSNPRALRAHGRNILDDQIKACARTGGVIGIVGSAHFLGDGDDCSAAAIARHIDYVVGLVGVEHVGLGIDSVVDKDEPTKLFERYPQAWPGSTAAEMASAAFAQPEQIPEITEALLAKGYSDDDVQAILGKNFLRVAAEVWR
jgi:membrane dipeptidase